MRRLLLSSLLLLWPAVGLAAVLNVEFQFTPFTGDPAKDDKVQSVAGTARVFLNGVPFAEQPVEKQELPVMFDEREIAPSVWITTEGLGPGLRKGKNTVRIEFAPADAKSPYRAQLRWSSVTDETREEREPGRYTGTNTADRGVQNEGATGTLVLQREFVADFARDLPWHHLPAVTALDADDERKLAALVTERTRWFGPDFAGVYRALEGRERIDVAAVRKAKCLEAAWKAGVRITPPAADQLEFVTTGNPEVVVRRKGGNLYAVDPAAFEKIRDDDTQMCAGMALSLVYPQKLVAVRTKDGGWEAVY